MRMLIGTPTRALLAGCAVTLVILALWLTLAGADRLGFASFLLRWLHVASGILWLGMIWFVNFIQFPAIAAADEAGRSAIGRLVTPRVATLYRHASHLNLLTGGLMLVTSGYVLDVAMFGSAVYMPPLRNMLLWGGVAGGVAMWAFVHFVIWPNLRIMMSGTASDPGAQEAARDRVVMFARLNLLLSVPVTFVMVAAAHLY